MGLGTPGHTQSTLQFLDAIFLIIYRKICDTWRKDTFFPLEFDYFFILKYDHKILRPTKFTPGKSRHVWMWLSTPSQTQKAIAFLQAIFLCYYLQVKYLRYWLFPFRDIDKHRIVKSYLTRLKLCVLNRWKKVLACLEIK